MFRSIRSRLLGLVLAAVVPFLALIGAGLWSQWRSDQDAALQRAIDEAQLIAGQVDDHIGNLENLLIGISRAVSTNPADVKKNDRLLREIRAEQPKFVANILVFSPDGTNIGTSSDVDLPESGRFNVRDRTYFHQVKAGQRLAIGDVVHARISGRWVVTIARPVEDAAGRLVAIVAVGTWLERFQDALRIQGLPPGSLVTIVNEQGVVVARSVDSRSWIGLDFSRLEPFARHLAAKEASELARWPDNVERITGSATAHRVPWLVSVGLPKDIAFAALVRRLAWGSLFAGIALVIAFAIAWMLSRRIVRPLQQLGRDAAVLASGQLSHRSQVDTRDEVGALANTFNLMAESLEWRQEEAARSADEVKQTKDTLAAVIDASPVAIICSDTDRRIVLWSRAAEQIFGYTAEETIGHVIKTVPAEGMADSQAVYARAVRGETLRDMEWKRMRKDGSLVYVRSAAAPMYNPDGAVRGTAWAHEDITLRKKAEEQLRRLAHYDQLTGLPNRLSLQKELGRLMSGDGVGRATSVVLFDLDRFKDVNDTLGHSIGDQLLIEVGRRLTAIADGGVQVCRLGGDEFVVVISDCGDPLKIGDAVTAMLKALAEPYEINDQVIHLAGSAGVAIAPADGKTVDELLANADLALYQAKADGGSTFRLFMPVLRAQAQARRGLDTELRRAFAESEFELYFQPQIQLADNAVVGAEALLRWRHPVRGILAPGSFLEALAESSISTDVGNWVIRSACATAADWRSQGLALKRVGLNLFPRQLIGDELLQQLEEVLRTTGLSAELLELEITENIALNYANATATLQKLHDRGLKLAFDDFGTGFASLSYLTKLPLSRIKIDLDFVRRITDQAKDAAIVRSLITMAHNLGLEVIAEGVETEAQATFLRNEGCEEAQGYLYAEPLDAKGFEAYLKGHMGTGTSGSGARQVDPKSGIHRRTA